MYNTILVPTDGSDPANRAVEHAFSLARKYDSTIHGLYVVDTNRYGEPALSSAEIVIDDLEDRGQAMLDELSERADDEGIEMVSQVKHGRPHVEIANYADDVEADVVVLGYQGQSHTRTDNIGTVAERVVRNAERPVFTV